MRYMTARSIAMLLLMLDKLLTERIGINNYFRLFNDVHRYYRTSCVIFVRSGNSDLSTTTLVHMWSREFSRQRVMTMMTTFSDLTSKYNKYQENVTRPLFVVLLEIGETMAEFAKTTRSIRPISFPIWFVVFLQCPGNPLEEHCTQPTDNPPGHVKDPVFLKMYKLLEKKKFLPELPLDGFKQICQQKNLAFYISEIVKEHFNMYIQCNLVYIDTKRIQNIGITLSKGNPYTDFINYHLQRFQSNGVMNKLRDKYLAKNPSNKMTYYVIDINDVTPVLTMIMGSMVLALFILIIEKMYYLSKFRSKNKKSSVKKLSYNLSVKNNL
ncbi:PREDICTED: uncharacterized protein LOC105458684 [Wasmannia auropunctata]|uniref:uncharacterized protein LOC105458684 n=1 Tax=Wasmannia auropunctata TaxID=64793 RepID=UPI0005F0244B|nr:PREDICTED: uncharacterized protein LOC105458684 [Wasmannia auropunctata]